MEEIVPHRSWFRQERGLVKAKSGEVMYVTIFNVFILARNTGNSSDDLHITVLNYLSKVVVSAART